jgi:hypothetical protein
MHRRYLAIVVALHLQTLGKINENIRIGRNDSLLVHSATRRREFGFHRGTARKSERVVPRERTVVRCIVNTTARSLKDEQLTKQKKHLQQTSKWMEHRHDSEFENRISALIVVAIGQRAASETWLDASLRRHQQ